MWREREVASALAGSEAGWVSSLGNGVVGNGGSIVGAVVRYAVT